MSFSTARAKRRSPCWRGAKPDQRPFLPPGSALSDTICHLAPLVWLSSL